MEVFGRKESEEQILKAGTSQHDIFCQPCQDEGENLPAESYCETCNAFMCSSCMRVHSKLPVTKNHVIKARDEMPEAHVQTDPCSELCNIHKTEILKFFCQGHDEVGCSDCMVLHHKACKVDLIPDVSATYSNSEELKQIKNRIEHIVKEIGFCKQVIACNLEAAAEMNLKVVEEIKKFRKDINIYIDNAEEELLNEVEQLRKSDVSVQNKLQDESDSMQKDLQEFQRTLDENTRKTNQLFVSAKLGQKKLKMFQESVVQISSKCQINIYKFEPAKGLLALEMNKSTLGSLSIQSNKNTAPRQRKKDMKVEFVSKSNVQAENEEQCWITGLAMISSDEILLADRTKNGLKLLNVRENKIISSYKLSNYPWDMTMISPGIIAVTVPKEKKILFMKSENRLYESHSLKVRGNCFGIDHKNGMLAVSFCEPPAVQILNMHGDVLHEVSDTSMLIFPSYIILSHNCNSIYVSDFFKFTVFELAMDGQLKTSTQCGKWSYPRGLAVTSDGTVLVCCENISNSVSMIVPDTGDVLPLSLEHVQKPMSILVCEEQNKLFICERNSSKDSNNIKIFDMK